MKENGLEILLNKLIERGWKPRNKEEVKRLNYHTLYREVVLLEFDNYNLGVSYSIRDLVSKESGLWQFCCENKLVKLIENPNENKCPRDRMSEEEFRIWEYNVYYSFSNKKDIHKRYEQSSSTYRLIESALKDESELEDFLLSNIKL